MNDQNDFISIRNHQTKSFPDKLMYITFCFVFLQKWFLIGVRFASATLRVKCSLYAGQVAAVRRVALFYRKKYRIGFLSQNKFAATRILLEFSFLLNRFVWWHIF